MKIPWETTFSRRRYHGKKTFCWAAVQFNEDGIWHNLGDPWPGVNWPRKALEQAVDAKRAELDAEFTLANDPPSRLRATFGSNDNTQQRVLIDWLDCLPGQQDLF